jgi:hypothetical protein
MQQQSLAFLRALDASGNEFFWTGRAGEAWVSPRREEALVAFSLEGARAKALQFNQRMALHGLRFVAVSA